MGAKRLLVLATASAVLGLATTSRAALVGEYLFEEGSGTTAEDTSGFNRDGTLTGASTVPVYTAGLYNGSTFALRMNSDGTTADQSLAQRVSLPSNTGFIQDVPGATLMAWVRYDGGSTSTGRTILSINNGSTGSRAAIQVSGTDFRVIGRIGDSGSLINATGTVDPVIGDVHFVAGVLDYMNGSLTLYVDGVQAAQTTNISGWTGNSANTVNTTSSIGSIALGTGEYWAGAIDGARIYNNAMTESEIQAIYNAEAVPEPASAAVLAGLAGVATLARRRKA